MKNESVRINHKNLEQFCREVFLRLDLSEFDAGSTAKVLVTADLRRIPSHGVGRLSRYVNGLKTGLMVPNAPFEIIRETPSSVVIDAHGAMGPPVGVKTMSMVIEKARESGSAFGSVGESNHYGIAGYYAMMALDENMIGISMTNTSLLGVPTFGRRAMFGTNPLAFAAPADKERAFVLDMSTTVVTRGKVEVYERLGKKLPKGWAVDKTGKSASDPGSLLREMIDRLGGGILPLGGEGEKFGGHKGFGLSIMVDILCALLSGSPFGSEIWDMKSSSVRVSHFFGALRIDAFREPEEFRSDMDRMLERLRTCEPAEGAKRVYYAGLKEFEKEDEYSLNGIPLLKKTYDNLCSIGKELGIDPPQTL
jgi:L-2-hydroxycarboxylate dehydrogenase (NAD+)